MCNFQDVEASAQGIDGEKISRPDSSFVLRDEFGPGAFLASFWIGGESFFCQNIGNRGTADAVTEMT